LLVVEGAVALQRMHGEEGPWVAAGPGDWVGGEWLHGGGCHLSTWLSASEDTLIAELPMAKVIQLAVDCPQVGTRLLRLLLQAVHLSLTQGHLSVPPGSVGGCHLEPSREALEEGGGLVGLLLAAHQQSRQVPYHEENTQMLF
jgi:hypothetical protein